MASLHELLADLELRIPRHEGVVLVHVPLLDGSGRVRVIVLADREGSTTSFEHLLSAADTRASFAAMGARRNVRWGSCDASAERAWTGLWTSKGTPFRLWNPEGIALVVREATIAGRAIGGEVERASVLEVLVRRRWFGHWSVALRTPRRDLHVLSAPLDDDDGVPVFLDDLATRLRVALDLAR
ncbi:MAG: hypothetical protein R3B99_23200 [Polyangiales bacterium]|nr:hypothetical protein [Myxococcales bacterium]